MSADERVAFVERAVFVSLVVVALVPPLAGALALAVQRHLAQLARGEALRLDHRRAVPSLAADKKSSWAPASCDE